MAAKNMNNIFLSASVPDKDRHPKYFETADVIAIRDAVRALATVVIPNSVLIWGGHPAITPLIRYVAQNVMKLDIQDHVILYQSEFFKRNFPNENKYFETVIITPEKEDRDRSLYHMREKMIGDHVFNAGIFIGGMEGVEQEFAMFRRLQPNAIILPVASTGAAARFIYNDLHTTLDKRLLDDFAYMAMFKALLKLKRG